MIRGQTFRRCYQGVTPSVLKKPVVQRSSVPLEKSDVPTVTEIAGFLIACAKAQGPLAVMTKSTPLSEVAELNLLRLTNRFLAKNTFGFNREDWALDANASFIENAHMIHDLLVPTPAAKDLTHSFQHAAKAVAFEKQLHGTTLRFQAQGPWNEKDLEEARLHLAFSAAEVAIFSTSKHPLNLTLISSKKVSGKTVKLRGGRTRQEEDRVDVRFAISRQGWQAPGAFSSALKSLALACLWPLSAFAFRPSLNWDKGEIKKHFFYRLKSKE